MGQTGKNSKNRDNPQLTWLNVISLIIKLSGSTLAKMWVHKNLIIFYLMGLRYGLRPPEKVQLPTGRTNREVVGVE